MSLNDLVKEEVHRQIDIAIQKLSFNKSRLSTPIAKARFQYENVSDFLLGFEYGPITGLCIWYYRNQVQQSGREVTKGKMKQVSNEIGSIIVDRLPEIRQAILRVGKEV